MSELMTTGQMQVNLEAALENAAHAYHALVKQGEAIGFDFWPPKPAGNKPGGAAYHLAAMIQYVQATYNAMVEQWGDTEGQLCPYDDCAHDLAFTYAGWWKCPACGRDFYAEATDGGIEDFHTYTDWRAGLPPIPAVVQQARDLGPSWATPK
jgi:hypothetical protein